MDIDRRIFVTGAVVTVGGLMLWRGGSARAAGFPYTLTDVEWKKRLTPGAYRVLRHEDTEAPDSSPLNEEHRAGTFSCAGCGQKLFSSKTKFDSGTGWPSFYAPLPRAIGTTTDRKMLEVRVEVHCARCGGHLGHVFDDGPKPTGKRYCMNGVAMKFTPGPA